MSVSSMTKNKEKMIHLQSLFHKWRTAIRHQNIITAAFFFFLSLSSWFGMHTMFPLCCLLAMSACRESTVAALVGIASSCLYQTLWGDQACWWNLICGVCLLCLPILNGHRNQKLILAAVLCSLPGILLEGFSSQYTHQQWLIQGLMVLGYAGMMPSVSKAARFMFRPANTQTDADDLLCVFLPVLIALSGMAKTSMWHLNFGYACAVMLTYLAASVLLPAAATAIGFLSGCAFLISGQGAYWAVALPLIGAAASFLHGKRKWVCSMAGLMVCMTTSLLLMQKISIIPVLSCAVGGMGWITCPRRFQKQITIALQRTRLIRRADHPYLEEKMKQMTGVLRKMSVAVPEPILPEKDIEMIAEEMAERMCSGCENQMICWHEQAVETKETFMTTAEAASFDGKTDIDMPHCIRQEKLHQEINRLMRKMTDEERKRQQVRYEQEMLNTHFDAISSAILKHIEESMRPADEERYQEKQIEEMLEHMRYPASVLYVKKEEGHYVLALRLNKSSGKQYDDEALERHISICLSRRMKITNRTECMLTLNEMPSLQIQCGVATACAISQERKTITPYTIVNGDAVVCESIRCGQDIVALSDGMGHGKGAGEESRKTLELITLCLKGGYTAKQALTAVNGMMLSATGGERFATVDMCTVDLWTGVVKLHKLGANMSVVIQGQHIRAVEGEALPLGIIEHVHPVEHEMRLGEGDMVMLVSDGITDAFEDEQAISTLIRRYLHQSPQAIADSLLQDALVQSGGLPRDDMTVVCFRLAQSRHQTYAY